MTLSCSQTWVLMLFHNTVNDWSFASSTFMDIVQIEDFCWTKIKGSLSGSPLNLSLPTSNNSTWTSTSVLSSMNQLIRPWPGHHPQQWAVDEPARRQIVDLLFSPLSPASVPVDARCDNASLWQSSYHASTSATPCSQAFQPAPFQLVLNAAAWFVASLPACAHVTDTMSLHCLPVTDRFITSCLVMYAIYNVASPSFITDAEFWCFLAVVGSDLWTPANLTYLAPEQNSERVFSVTQSESPAKYVRSSMP